MPDGPRKVETAEYSAFLRRIARAMATRIGEADPDALRFVAELEHDVDALKLASIEALLAIGYSYAEIGAGLGTTKQAVSQWHKRHRPVAGER